MGSLAYELDGDLYVANWDGSNPVRITNECGDTRGEGTIWSPDGRYLAYRHVDCGAAGDAWGDVVISDQEDNVLASFPGEGWLVSWSPDSTRVAVWVRWGETIGVYGLDGVRQALLTVPPGMMAPGDFDPVWSRDGASLVVPRGVEIPLDGSTPRQLPSSDPRVFDARFSPDGSRVAYTVALARLVVASADGTGARELVQGPVWDPIWSPAGDQIAFVYQTSETDDGYTAATELRVVDVATGAVTRLAGMITSVHVDHPQFSPDGERILFTRAGGEGQVSLWTVRADGSDARRLVAGSGWGEWQPSGDAG
jgi:Tol biopolymer transport system component